MISVCPDLTNASDNSSFHSVLPYTTSFCSCKQCVKDTAVLLRYLHILHWLFIVKFGAPIPTPYHRYGENLACKYEHMLSLPCQIWPSIGY